MTRFARAKGSKASNEKLPEDATSWSEMKESFLNKSKELVEEKEREEVLKLRQHNYDVFLQERDEEESKNLSWANFQEAHTNEKGPHKNSGAKKSKNAKKLKNMNNSDSGNESSDEFKLLKSKVDQVLNNSENEDDAPEEISSKVEIPQVTPKKAKNSKKKLKVVIKSEQITSGNNNNISISCKDKSPKNVTELTEKEQVLIKKRVLKQKKQNEKRKLKRLEQRLQKNGEVNKLEEKSTKVKNLEADKDNNKNMMNNSELTEKDLKKIEKKKAKAASQAEKRKKFKEENEQINSVKKTTFASKNKTFDNKINKSHANQNNSKEKKPRDNEEHQRRKEKADKLFINGKTVSIDYVDGYPVKKEDADRLSKLRKEMISKGLPRSEINIALKLERRRAEKSFSREKKNVCFKCRQSGHNLSECPELNKDQVAETAGSGICYKCGSTEHTHFECKIVKGMEYKFATCFICKEPGHIARQCPDNQKGLYPKGGSCKVCGDVTHLKKDCPKFQAQQVQLQSSFNISTMDINRNPEDFGNVPQTSLISNNRVNKIIKF